MKTFCMSIGLWTMTETRIKSRAKKSFEGLATDPPTKQEQQIQELQEELTAEQDARKEDRFFFILTCVILLNIVFFTLMPTFGGPLALLVLELLILIPLARRMGMEEIAEIANGVITRLAGKAGS